MFTAILNKGLNTPYEYENILVTNYGSSVIYFENQSPNMETRDCKLSNDICQYYLKYLLRYYCWDGDSQAVCHFGSSLPILVDHLTPVV